MNNKQKLTKVAIGVPSGDMIHADFAMSLINLSLTCLMKGVAPAIINQKSSIIEVGRNEIIAQAKQLKADYLLMLDSDMLFPADLFFRLESWGKGVVCCDAVQRREPFNQVVKTEDGEKIDHTDCAKDLIKLSGSTSACMLVDMKVFEKVEGPHYIVEWKDGKFLGEDYYFTKLLNQHGIDVWCDVALSKQIGHIGCQAFYVKQ